MILYASMSIGNCKNMKNNKQFWIRKMLTKIDEEPAMLFFVITFLIGVCSLAIATSQTLKILSYSYIVLNLMIIFVLGKEQ